MNKMHYLMMPNILDLMPDTTSNQPYPARPGFRPHKDFRCLFMPPSAWWISTIVTNAINISLEWLYFNKPNANITSCGGMLHGVVWHFISMFIVPLTAFEIICFNILSSQVQIYYANYVLLQRWQSWIPRWECRSMSQVAISRNILHA